MYITTDVQFLSVQNVTMTARAERRLHSPYLQRHEQFLV
jgi:hypothetical protein